MKVKSYAKIAALGLCFAFAFCGTACNKNQSGDGEEPSKQETPANKNPEGDYVNTDTLLYVPLDDRPVNVDRVVYLAESLDYNLVMPNADLYSTHLDNQKKNSNGTQYGDRVALLKWLKETPADGYVLSLDQMLSGGLVNSRIMTEASLNETYAIIDDVVESIGDKPAVVIDSVMRLASTVGYNGYQMTEYNALRSYGGVARATLSGDDLTIENILAGYRNGENGEKVGTELTDEIIDAYLSARERKLKIADYYLKKTADKKNIFTYFGVDDSSPKTTIQTNEIEYIKARCEYGTIFAGIDELGLMGVTRLYLTTLDKQIGANVVYFGGGEDLPADDYDTGTLKNTVKMHMDSLNMREEQGAQLQIMVLTKPGKGVVYKTAADQMAAKINEELEKGSPVIVIDASTSAFYGRLQNKLVANTKLAMLLGYSNWNTGSNTVGCALATGVARYTYLKYAERTQEGTDGFLKLLCYSYVKDISYKASLYGDVQTYVRENVGDTGNFYATLEDEAALNRKVEEIISSRHSCNAANILKKFNASEYILSLNNYETATHGAAKTLNYHFPWYRTFEITFDVVLENKEVA